MKIRGFSSNMYGWIERWKADGREPDWEDLYRACAEAGLDAVETDPSPDKLALVRANGLAVSASYLGLPLHGDYAEIEEAVLPFAERLAAAGGSDMLVNADPYGGWKNPLPKPEELVRRQGDNLSRLAHKLSPLGLQLSLHNHAADRHNAEADLYSVVRYSDAAVGLCVDTGWAHVAGCNPAEWVREYPERIKAFHFRNQRGRVPVEDVTEGEIDMKAVLEAAAAAGYQGWIALELWHPPETKAARSMIEDVQRSIAYLRNLIDGL